MNRAKFFWSKDLPVYLHSRMLSQRLTQSEAERLNSSVVSYYCVAGREGIGNKSGLCTVTFSCIHHHPLNVKKEKCWRQSSPIYLCNHFRVHGPVVVEALWPPSCHSFPDLRAVYPVLQRWVSADRIEAAVATDGAFVWNLLGKTLAHYGLRWGSGTGYGSWGGWFCQWAT